MIEYIKLKTDLEIFAVLDILETVHAIIRETLLWVRVIVRGIIDNGK